MRNYLKGNKIPLQALMPAKINAIESARGDGIYFESNHCFIKGFGWEILKHVDPKQVAVIVLKRSKSKIVKSYLRIGSDPHGEDGLTWMITPNKKNLIKAPISILSFSLRRFISLPYYKLVDWGLRGKKVPSWNQKSAEKLLNWYYDETYALSDAFRLKFKAVTYIDAAIDDLNNMAALKVLFKSLNIPDNAILPSMNTVVGVPSNLKKR